MSSDFQTTDTTQKSGTRVCKILTPLAPSLVKTVNLNEFK